MTNPSRRIFLCGAAALGARPATAGNKQETRRFQTPDYDIELTVEYYDGYASRGFWFHEGMSNGGFCLSAEGEANRQCLSGFRGSLAITRFRVRPRSGSGIMPLLRERVWTVDHDARLRLRAPYERTIELKRGIGSDLQAFGYELSSEKESEPRAHGPWYLFRQDLFLEPHPQPFLAIFWKHALPSIRMLDLIPGELTWPAAK